MADKTYTVNDDMPSRRVFANKEAAANYLAESMSKYEDFGNYNIVTPIDLARGVQGLSQDEEGNLIFDAEIFPDDMEIMVAVLTQRGKVKGDASTVKAITVSPVPSFEAVLNDAQGRAWIEKIVATELNRNAVRTLRPDKVNVTDQQILAALPRTLADYVTSNRGGSSTAFEAFEEYWKAVKNGLGKVSKAWKLANLSKREFKNAMSSTAYASRWYPTLEEAKGVSLFVLALQAFQKLANDKGMDASIFETWLATRDEYEIEETDEADDDEDEGFSFDMLAAAIESDDEEAPAADASEAQGDEATEEEPASAG